ncbi:MAG: CapA family protein [Dehalococcoidia bacterium]|nr:CapA family protein [Dehalococcoidia bacterium]
MRRLAFVVGGLVLVAIACRGGDGESPAAIASRTPEPTPPPFFIAPEDVPTITLGDIFGPAADRGLSLDPTRLRTLIATGDVIPARNVNNQIIAHGNDFFYPLSDTADILRQADLTVANLEAPLVEGCPPSEEGFTFCGQPGFAGALREAGVDVATLENNHIDNYGPEGVAATEALLTASGIDHANYYTLAVRDVRGLRFGFLAFNGVGGAFDRELVRRQIEETAGQVDVLVVSFHWGKEYVTMPQADPGIAADDPVEIAHLAVDAGADLVLGNHPHWVQGVEVYAGKLIAYAHGNFIADQMWSYATTIGVIGRYTFYDSELVGVQFTPVRIEDYARPVPLQGEEAQAVLDRMYQASVSLQELLATGQ